jgi:photosystem II stability/assembly factor-like uncharacterized protein
MRKSRFLIHFILFLLFFSCKKDDNKKDDNALEWSETVLFSDYIWNDISVPDDQTAYISGWKNNPDNNIENLYLLIKSVDGGLTWNSVYDNPDIYSKGGWDYIYFSDRNNGIITGSHTLFKTNDGGITWDTTNFEYNIFLEIYQIDLNHLLGFNGGFFESTNAGETWIRNDSIYSVFAIDFIDSLTGYICVMNGILKTTDGGKSWSNWSNYVAHFSNVDFVDENNAIAIISEQKNSQDYPKIYLIKTVDGGKSWSKLISDSTNIIIPKSPNCILFESINELYVGDRLGIYFSSDFGKTWTIESNICEIRSIAKMNNHFIAAGADGIILRK